MRKRAKDFLGDYSILWVMTIILLASIIFGWGGKG